MSYTSKKPRHRGGRLPTRPIRTIWACSMGPIGVYLALIGSLPPLSLGLRDNSTRERIEIERGTDGAGHRAAPAVKLWPSQGRFPSAFEACCAQKYLHELLSCDLFYICVYTCCIHA